MLNQSIADFSGLRCRLINALPAQQAPGRLMVLCHGFGAPGDDLAGLGPYLLDSNESLREHCQLVFPEAPLSLAHLGMPGGRAWWEINMAALSLMHQTRDFEQLASLTPDGMLDASQQLADAVRQMQQKWGLSDEATILGGFSQGAMISTDLVLRHGFCPELLCLFSGTLICRDDWTQFAARHPGCPVYQSHGHSDQVLPFDAALKLRQLLSANGFTVTFDEFSGGHTIPPSALNCFG